MIDDDAVVYMMFAGLFVIIALGAVLGLPARRRWQRAVRRRSFRHVQVRPTDDPMWDRTLDG